MIKHFKTYLLSGFLFLFCFISVQAQIRITVVKGKKDVYRVGDKVQLQIQLKTIAKTCVDGMKRANVFVSGIDINNQTDWKQIGVDLWQKDINAVFLDNKKKKAKITVMRQVDVESLFQQEVFVVQNP